MSAVKVGVVLSRRCIEVAALDPGGRDVGIVYRRRAVGTPEGSALIEAGQVAKTVLATMDDAGIARSADVGLCFGIDWTYTASVRAPQVRSGAKARALLLYEAESQWPVDVEDLQTRIIPQPADGGHVRALVLGCPADILRACERVLRDRGHRVRLVTASPLVAAHRMKPTGSTSTPSEALLCWDEPGAVGVARRRDGRIAAACSLNGSFLADRSDTDPALAMRAALRGLAGRNGQAAILSWGSRASTVADTLARSTRGSHTPCPAQESAGIEDGSAIPAEDDRGGGRLAAACARLVDRPSAAVDVAIGESAHQARVRRMRAPLIAMFAVASVAILLAAARLLMESRAMERRVVRSNDALQAAWESVNDDPPPASGHIVIRLRGQQQHLSATRGGAAGDVTFRDVLETWRSVTASIPKDVKVFLTDITVDQQGMTIKGETTTHGSAERVRAGIRRTGLLEPDPPRSHILAGGGVGFTLSATYGDHRENPSPPR